MFFVHILKCPDESLYVGHTDDLNERRRQYDAGKFASYTARRRPLQLLHVDEFESRLEAIAMERKLKGCSKANKLAISGDWQKVGALSKDKHQWERSK